MLAFVAHFFCGSSDVAYSGYGCLDHFLEGEGHSFASCDSLMVLSKVILVYIRGRSSERSSVQRRPLAYYAILGCKLSLSLSSYIFTCPDIL